MALCLILFFSTGLPLSKKLISNKLSLAGEDIDWTINILLPLIFSLISTYISPSENFLIFEY